ncbi:MAG: hypothetical protein IJT30_04810 [Muribaculaceae bacterium]|nr:hypothetical protein [Muribaculaceae bacterium]
MSASTNSRIARNTVFLYLRMFVSMCISLYTSRVVLNALGTSDYGIYGIVGSIVVFFSFLNTTLSTSTSRFLTFQLGRDDHDALNHTFTNAVMLHVGIALIILVLAETIGLWFLNNHLVIPAGRLDAANWVYQLSVVACMTGIIEVPFKATVISHERMDFYAYASIAFSLLKLGIVFLLAVSPYDKLIFYATLIFACQVVIFWAYFVYCRISFSECRLSLRADRGIMRSMVSFSGWTLYSNICFTTRQQGSNVLLNLFGGTVVNAAAGLASTTLTILEQFASNLVMASRPQIIKHYAQADHSAMLRLMSNTSLFANMLFLVVAVPFVTEISYILRLWLVNVPPYMVGFSILLIAGAYISLNNNVLFVAIQASGSIRTYSLLAGTTSVLVIPVAYLFFKNGSTFYWVYILPLFTNSMIYLYCLFVFKRIITGAHILRYMRDSLLRPTLCAVPAVLLSGLLTLVVEQGFVRLVLIVALSTGAYISCAYFALTKEMRNTVISQLSQLKQKFIK